MNDNSDYNESEAIHAAVLDAYDEGDLIMFVQFNLNLDFTDHVSSNDNYSIKVFKFLKFLSQNGWLQKLTNAIIKDKPDNEKIKAITVRMVEVREVKGETSGDILAKEEKVYLCFADPEKHLDGFKQLIDFARSFSKNRKYLNDAVILCSSFRTCDENGVCDQCIENGLILLGVVIDSHLMENAA